MATPDNALLAAALAYARLGWRVFPLSWIQASGKCSCGQDCVSPGKHPRIRAWQQNASRDEAEIRSWWRMWPQANIGIQCGAESGLWVLDVDDADTFAEFLAGRRLAADVEQITGGGNRHLLFAHPGRPVVTRAPISPMYPGVDVRGDGGYIVAPPSTHISGNRYEWDAAGDPLDGAVLGQAPDWLLDLVCGSTNGASRSTSSSTGQRANGPNGPLLYEETGPITEGGRNAALFKIASSLRGRGLGHAGILAELIEINQARCSPPLPESEIRSIAASASKLEANSVPRASTPPMDPGEPPTPPSYPPAEVLADEQPPKEYSLSDLGNAERMADAYGRDLRYCAQWGKWLVWDGMRWAIDDNNGARAMQLAIETVRQMARDAFQIADNEKRGALLEFAGKCHSRSRLDNMVALLRSLPGVPVVPDELDRHRMLLNTISGTIDLESCTLRPHHRHDLITRVIEVPYDSTADCPRWTQFLEEVIPDAQVRRYVWKAAGYSLTGMTHEKCFFFLYGAQGDNGKSVFVETLKEILGGYARQTDTGTLMARNVQGGINNDVARLKEARVVFAPETEEGKRLDEGLIKRLTGGDTITARYLHQEFFEFVPQFKIWMSGNHKPVIRGTDDAIWRRIALVPFPVVIPKEKQDGKLREKLLAESAGILAWMVDGCAMYRTEGLGKPDTVNEAVESYRDESDVLGAFLDEETYTDTSRKVSAQSLYDRYAQWCKRNGQFCKTNIHFGKAMTERGEQREHTRTGKFYLGRALIEKEGETDVYRGSTD